MKRINGILFDDLVEFNQFIAKATNNKIQMEVDWDRNEWVWSKIGNEITESNILHVLSEYLKEDVNEIVAEIEGYFGKCHIIVVLE